MRTAFPRESRALPMIFLFPLLTSVWLWLSGVGDERGASGIQTGSGARRVQAVLTNSETETTLCNRCSVTFSRITVEASAGRLNFKGVS